MDMTTFSGAVQCRVEKIAQQGVAVLGQDRFGMELHAFDRQRLVAHTHDFIDAPSGVWVQAVMSRQSGNGGFSITRE
jgi:hypothetical protein